MACLYQLKSLSMKNENNNQIFQNSSIESTYLNELLKTNNITQNLNILIEMDKITLNDIESDSKLLNVYSIKNEKDLKVIIIYILFYFIYQNLIIF
jgi:hypothetical protein